MAEFCEVMRQAARMCAQHGNSCEGCPVYDDGIECPLEGPPESWKLHRFAEYERMVMDWAEKHPEPRYPTWVEWWKANFPNALHSICPHYFMREKPLGTCAASCAKCISTPIPADIAEKLGIKPMGGEEDA